MRDIELRLTADLDGATREVAGFTKEYGQLVKVVEKPLRQVNAFRDLETNVEKTGKAMRDARDSVRDLSAELVKAENPSRQLQENYKASVRELQRLERVEATQVSQLSQMGVALRSAGVDTQNLAAEQSRLSVEYGKALLAGRASQSLSGAKSSLGVTAVRDSQVELVKLREQYALVRSSGEVSARDLGIAQDNYRKKVSETLAKLRELRSVNATPLSTMSAVKSSASSNLGITQLKALQYQLATLTADYQRLTRSGVLSAQERAVAEEQYRRKVEQTRKAMADLAGEQKKSSSSSTGGGLADGVALAGGGVAAAAAAVAYLRMTDTAKKMDAQLKLATNSQDEFNQAQKLTFGLAQQNQAPLEGVVTLYSQLAPALAQMGRGQQDTIGVIDAVTKSLRISGATASETASTVLQFSQALGSGVLRGDEFNSIAENSPRLLRALADGLKVPTGALRNMAAAGQLTADVIVDTLLGQLPKLAAEAKALPETFGGSLTQLNNQLTQTVKQFDEFSGASSKAIALAQSLTKAMGAISSGEFGDSFREDKQSVAGFNNEISAALSRIRDLGDARARLNKKDPSDTVFFDWKFMTQADFDKQIAIQEAFIANMKKGQDKLIADQGGNNSAMEKLAADRANADRKESTDLKAIQTKRLADLKVALEAQLDAERVASSNLKKVKDEQLKTQQKYNDALAAINSASGSGEASYSTAQDLKVGARQALQRGDTASAKKQADDALKVLQQLADAGENTYGFGGFIKELQAIETAADGIDLKKAQDGVTAATDKAADLKAELDKLGNVQITPTMSKSAKDAVIKEMQDLKVKLEQAFEVPVAIKPTQDMQTIAGQSSSPITFPTSSSTPAATTPTPAPEATAAVKKKLAYQDGVNSYNQDDLSVAVQPVLADGSQQKLASEVAAQGSIPVAVTPTLPEGGVGDLDVPVVPRLDDSSVSAAQSQVAAVAEQMRQALVVPVTVVGPSGASTAPSASTDGLPGFAAGDMVRGRGTGTSDSILARLSNGEFVMRAAAVQHYGPELLRQINERRLPRFAEGGEVGRLLPDVPAPAQSILQQLNPAAPESMGSVALSIGGETYQMQAPQQDFQRLIRNQRVKFGKS
jgi:tape measure domain-containing protein